MPGLASDRIRRTAKTTVPLNKGHFLWGKRFDPVAREQFFDRQPPYCIEETGISGLTFRPVAQARIPSIPILNHILLADGQAVAGDMVAEISEQVEGKTKPMLICCGGNKRTCPWM